MNKEALPSENLPEESGRSIEEEFTRILEESNAEANHPVEREFFEAKKRALSGSVEAQVEVGKAYLEGILVEKNEHAAFNNFRQAAEQGCAEAQYWIGWCYNKGRGVERSNETAFQYYQLAAEQGHPEALRRVGDFYFFGVTFEEDIDQAIHYYRLAAKKGSAEAHYWLGWMYYRGKDLRQSDEKAFEHYKQSADQGFSDAQEEIAKFYETGKGVEKSNRMAFHYYQLCSDQGSKIGLKKLGDFYFEGRGVEKSYEKAFKYYQHADSDRKIAKCYYLGKGVEQSDEKAIEYFDRVIEKRGEPWEKELESKMIAIEKALAEQGDSKFLFHMALHHRYGTHGVECSNKKAFGYFCRAIEQGHTRAIKVFEEYCQKHIFKFWTQANQELVENVFHRFLALVDQGSYWTIPWLASFHQSRYCYQKHAKSLISRFNSAAEQGDLDALIALAVAHETGKGVEKSEEKALDYKKRAARFGSVRGLKAIFDSPNIEEKELSSILNDFEKRFSPKKVEGNLLLGKAYFEGKGVGKSYEKAFEHYKIAADQGAYNEAHLMIGLCYKNGWGVEQSDDKAHEYLLLAAETLTFLKGILNRPRDEALLVNACSAIGHLYQENLGTEESCMYAISWYERAENYFEIAEAYRMGRGVEQSAEMAFKYYKKAVEHGDYRAFCSLGKCYQSGDFIERSDEKAFAYYEKAAEEGVPEALFELGNIYLLGRGVEISEEKAFYYFKQSADQGFEKADFSVGECYRLGIGGEQSYERAFAYFKKAAEKGHLKAKKYLEMDGATKEEGLAQTTCGSQHDQGKLQTEEAIDHFHLKRMADVGDASAQYSLARLYAFGDGVVQSDEISFLYYRLAADRGHPVAQVIVGSCYFSGPSIERSDRLAYKYFKLAAEQGESDGLLGVSECYRLGKGVEQSDEKAFEYCKMSADRGNAWAQALVAEYYSQGKGVKKSLGKVVEYFSLLATKDLLARLQNSVFDDQSYGFDLNACKIWLHHFLSEVITIAEFTVRDSEVQSLRKIRNTLGTEDLGEFVEHLSRWDVEGISRMWKLLEGVSPTSLDSPISPLNRVWRVCGKEEGLKGLKESYGSLISASILEGFPSFVRLMKIIDSLEVEDWPFNLWQDDIPGTDEQRSAA